MELEPNKPYALGSDNPIGNVISVPTLKSYPHKSGGSPNYKEATNGYDG
jgi:hypothetical protein